MNVNGFPNDEKVDIKNQVPRPQGLPSKIRRMPIDPGGFLFSSIESFERFKRFHYKRAELNPDGLGIPLFHFRHHSFRNSDFIIEKYILQDVRDPPPAPPYKIKKRDENLVLYKVEFCKVYTDYSKGNSLPYDIEFTRSFGNVWKYDFIRLPGTRQGFYGSVNGFDLSWKTLNVEKSGDHELFVNYDDISQLIDNGFSSTSKKQDQELMDGPLSPQGLYERDLNDAKVQNCYHRLSFVEKTGTLDLGIRNVSPMTEFLSLHGILLHHTVTNIILGREARERAVAQNNMVFANDAIFANNLAFLDTVVAIDQSMGLNPC